MVWFHVDDAMAFHPKAIEAGNAALGLWVRAGAWSTGTRSDGQIPRRIAYRLGTRQQVNRLITAGLWEVKNDGFLMHDWAHYQESKTSIETRREVDRLRKREQRKRENVPPGHPDRDSARSPTPPVPTGVPSESPPRGHAFPTHPFGGYLGGGSAVGSDPALEPADAGHPQNQFCEKHPYGTDKPCRECRHIREYNERQQSEERRKRRAAIDACPYCEDNGMRETPDGLTRCTHNTDTFEPF